LHFYGFKEVRVPLNTAVLAAQNLAATTSMAEDKECELEFNALEGSLSMMSTGERKSKIIL